MADQFLGIQAFNGTPVLIGANTKAPGGTKAGDGGEFPGVLVQAFLGGVVQASKDHTKAPAIDLNPDTQGKNDQHDDGSLADAATTALAGSANVQGLLSTPIINGNETVPVDGSSSQGDTGGSLKILASQGATPAMEAALALMEPAESETLDAAALLASQDPAKGKGSNTDILGGQQTQMQEPRPVYKLLRDIALGIFSASLSQRGSIDADSMSENLATVQPGPKVLASEIAQNILSSVDKSKKGPGSEQGTNAPEAKPTLISEMSRVMDSGDRQPLAAVKAPAEKATPEVAGTTNQQGIPSPVVEENKPAQSIPALPVGDQIHKTGDTQRQESTESKAGNGDQGSKHAEGTVLPQGGGVNAASSERQAGDSLFGRSMASAFHQQITGSTPEGIAGKELMGGAASSMTQLTPELSQSVLEQVAKGLALQVQGKVSEMRLTLKPESLGEMAVKVRVEDGKMQAQIDVSQPAVKAVVETNLSQLRQALSDNGIEVQRIDVFAAAQDAAHESNGQRGEKPKQRGGRRGVTLVESAEPSQAARMMGYNTMEIII